MDTDRRRTRAAWTLTGLREWRAAKSDGCARAISVLRRQGHAVPYPRHEPARIYWPSHLLGLHPHDQRGRDRPLQSRQGRHDCRCPPADLLVIWRAPRPQHLDRHSSLRYRPRSANCGRCSLACPRRSSPSKSQKEDVFRTPDMLQKFRQLRDICSITRQQLGCRLPPRLIFGIDVGELPPVVIAQHEAGAVLLSTTVPRNGGQDIGPTRPVRSLTNR